MTATVILAASASFAASDSTQQFRSAKYGYRIDLPGGWTAVPREVLDEVTSSMRERGIDTQIVYDAGFQRASAENWFEHPYVLVQPIPLSGQIHEHEFADYVEYISGIGAEQILAENPRAGHDATVHFQAINYMTPYLDRANRRFFMPMRVHVDGVGEVRSLTVGYFGRDSIVQIAFYALSDDWEQHSSDRDAIFDSFRFFPPKAYSAELAASSAGAAPIGRRIQRLAIGLGTLLAVSYLIVSLLRKCARKPAGHAPIAAG